MHKGRILDLANKLETNAFEYLDFHMETIAAPKDYEHPECGTNCCIVGYTLACKNGEFHAPENGVDGWDDPLVKEAQDYLGLTRGQMEKLFFPDSNTDDFNLTFSRLAKVTRQDAAETLRKLARTGRVYWQHVSKRFA